MLFHRLRSSACGAYKNFTPDAALLLIIPILIVERQCAISNNYNVMFFCVDKQRRNLKKNSVFIEAILQNFCVNRTNIKSVARAGTCREGQLENMTEAIVFGCPISWMQAFLAF